MTKAQIELLKRCILCVRTAENRDHEMVEVGLKGGVSKRTAKSLVDAGLLVEDWPTWSSEFTRVRVRLPREDEIKFENS